MPKKPIPSVTKKSKLPQRIGIFVILGLALVIGGVYIYHRQRESARPPIIEHHVQGAALGDGIAPVPEFLLRHRQELRLSDTQVKKITAIAAAYRSDSAPTKAKADAAATEYQKYLERTGNEQRPDMVEIEKQGAEVQRLSRILAASRHRHWKQARAALTAEQQQQADALAARARSTDIQ